MITSAYIHIPYCRRKCNYCSFVSYADSNSKDLYITALCKEIKSRYKGEPLRTLYIGGGTPSLLNNYEIKKITDNFNFANNAEITCEANPENLSIDWLKGIKSASINRLSLGVQAFDNKTLFLIGRKHSVQDVYTAIKNARNVGFDNINIDLIYGLPDQNIEAFISSIIFACELAPEHISSYGLKIEENSYFYNHFPKNLPDENMQAEMYLKLCEITAKNDYEHYEISNFSKKGYNSQHNLNYWNAENYYGFGCAACGYENDKRYSHHKTIDKYCENPILLTEQEIITPQMKLEEFIFLGLRKSAGINISEFNRKFNMDFEKKYSDILNKYSDYFIKNENNIAFTNEGFLLSNYILSDFIE